MRSRLGSRLVVQSQYAFRQGLHVLEGHVLYDNQPMLDLLRTSGHPVQVRCDGGDLLSVDSTRANPLPSQAAGDIAREGRVVPLSRSAVRIESLRTTCSRMFRRPNWSNHFADPKN